MNGITSEQFFIEFKELIDRFVMKFVKLTIVGNFNIHWDVQHSPDTKCLIDLLQIHLIFNKLSLNPHMRMDRELFPAR